MLPAPVLAVEEGHVLLWGREWRVEGWKEVGWGVGNRESVERVGRWYEPSEGGRRMDVVVCIARRIMKVLGKLFVVLDWIGLAIWA